MLGNHAAAAPLMTLAFLSTAHAASLCDSWTLVPSPDVSVKGDNTFAAVAGSFANDVWAVGQFAPDNNVNITQTFVAHYDGAAWSAIPSPNVGAQANALHGIATRSGLAWAVGYFIDDKSFYSHTLILFWDSAQWQVVGHPTDPGVSAVLFGVTAVAVNDVWAVGEFEQPLDHFHALIEHFDGRTWSVVPSPDPGSSGDILYGAAATAPGGVWAVGERNGDRSPDRPLILNWNGLAWSVQPPPADDSVATRLYAIAPDAAGTLHAAGEAENDAVGTFALAEMAAPGRPWAIQPTKQVGSSDNHFYGTTAAPDGTAWAVGAWFDPKSGRQFTLTERASSGQGWSVIPSSSPSHGGDSLLGAVAVVEDDVWAVGAYDGPQAQRSLIEHTCR